MELIRMVYFCYPVSIILLVLSSQSVFGGVSTANSKYGKVETHIDIRAAGAARFYDAFVNRPYSIPRMLASQNRPVLYTRVNVHGYDHISGGKVGPLVDWTYIQDGETKVAKEIIEAIDRKNNSATWKVIGGDLLEYYKSFKFILQITTQDGDQDSSVVHWTLEYEKVDDNVPDPNALLQLVTDMSKDVIRAHLNT